MKSMKEKLEFVASTVCFAVIMGVVLYFYVVLGG